MNPSDPHSFHGLLEAGQWHKVKPRSPAKPIFHTVVILIITLLIRDPLPFTSVHDVTMGAWCGIGWMWAYWFWLKLRGDTFTFSKVETPEMKRQPTTN
jgi:hypothetical protein